MYPKYYKENDEMLKDLVGIMPINKKKQLQKMFDRTEALTSDYGFECVIYVYKEGFYLRFCGTRSSFNCFIKDNDGELSVCKKPNDSKLNLIWIADTKCDYYDDIKDLLK